MKKVLSVTFIVVLCATLVMGCGKKDSSENIQGGTVASDLYLEFNEIVKNNTNVSEIAGKLCESPVFGEVATGSIDIEEGFLNGFDAEITGFNKGAMFAPMIGTIPFVGYIFETENPDALIDTLSQNANLNWNICTTADEMLVKSNESIVFFVMAPTSFDQ